VIEDPAALLAAFTALPAAAPVLGRLREWPEDVYVVGGAVRDLMLGDQPADLDLLVTGPVEPIAGRIGGVTVHHDRFGTAAGEIDGHRYDIARARRESYAEPGALPDVAPAGVREDLERRDFTVNAIALGILGPARGRLIAAEFALDDLRARRLRVLHDASFRDDPTRLVRLSRYRGRLGFAIESRTLSLADAAIAAGALATVSGARVGTELRLLAAEPDPVTPFLALHEIGADTGVHPGFGLTDPELARRGLALLPADGTPGVVVLAASVLGLARGARRALLHRLAFPGPVRDQILDASAGPELGRRLARAATPSEIAAVVGAAGPEAIALAGAAGAPAAARRWLEDLRSVRLQITGTDLIDAGVAAGPAVGRGLAAALNARLDGRAPDRATQLAVALEAARGEGD
jgi:tRNA nucleotidyltransferase (CCA-adding enzyme)